MTSLNRITIHWTAGVYRPNAIDKSHYHFLVDGDGKIINGTHKPEDNIDYLSYKMLNIKRNFLTGKQTCYLEYMYTKDDLWYCHNKPEHYMKEFAKALVNDFNHERIYHGKNV